MSERIEAERQEQLFETNNDIVMSPEEQRFTDLVEGMKQAGLVDEKEAIDILAYWRKDYYGRENR